MKSILLACLFFVSLYANSQYIAVRAKYIDTRLVDNSPEPPSRENRLILTFYAVSPAGIYSFANLSNYDLWVYTSGLQFGSQMGGVVDSFGNNYPGYPYTAPKAVSYYNSLGLNYVDCDPNAATHYVVNGHELDCGFVRVSSWEAGNEFFWAPNILLPYYVWPDPYFMFPGNLNFTYEDIPPTPPYNVYNFSCGGSLQVVIRGLLGRDSIILGDPLPVNFAYVRGEIQNSNTAKISWSNLTESDIDRYEVQKSVDNGPFISLNTIAPKSNNSDRADYEFSISQIEKTALYKIKAVEFSGKVIYSNIISLRLADTNGPAPDVPVLTVYPNPVTEGIISIRLTNAVEGRYIAMVVTPDGKQVKHKMIEHSGGDLTKQIEMNGLLPGIYQFVIRSQNYKYTQKFIYVR